MGTCAICLGSTQRDADYHAACIESLFGTEVLPAINVSLRELHKIAVKMAGKMSISGMQEKVSLKLSPDRARLIVAATGGRYILKPESSRFPALPQNEHLTMRLASLVGIEVPSFGLLRLQDDSLSYVVKRFDRCDDGSKLRVEDFCQLSAKPLRDKYSGSAEVCIRALRQYASEPLVQLRSLYKLLLFGWWVANGDMHLKNFSLITGPDGICRLAPAYDLVCTRLVIPDDSLALPVGGKTKNLTRRSWLDLAAYCKLPEKVAKRVIDEQVKAMEPSLTLISKSFLPSEMKSEFQGIIRDTTARLTA
ncbi:MAG: HipA domain-containing protein [Candidatus Nealsonbacteria bacterium]|nr:HipA domain-containing protein [Candidatus Nealsonbacteria bacterium]